MSILATFDSKMRIFLTKTQVTNMLSSKSTLPLNQLNLKPTAIFLILPDEKTSFHSIVSLFVKQSYEYFIDIAQSSTNGNDNSIQSRINYVLDEFSSLPTIKDFPAMITAARSRNIRFNIFVQSKHQMLLRYGQEADTILTNCKNWIFLTSREISLLRELSALAGEITERGSMERQVLPIAELQRLNKDSGEAVIMRDRCKPYLATLPDIELYEFEDEDKVLMDMVTYSSIIFIDFDSIVKELSIMPSDKKIKYTSHVMYEDCIFKEISSYEATADKKINVIKCIIGNFLDSTSIVNSVVADELKHFDKEKFIKYEASMLKLLIVYLIDCAPPDEQNAAMLAELLVAGRVPYEGIYNYAYKSDIDRLFDMQSHNKDTTSVNFVQEYGMLKEKIMKDSKSYKMLDYIIESVLIRYYPISILSEKATRLELKEVTPSFVSDLYKALIINFVCKSEEETIDSDIVLIVLGKLIKSTYKLSNKQRDNSLGVILACLLENDVNILIRILEKLDNNRDYRYMRLTNEQKKSSLLHLKHFFEFYKAFDSSAKIDFKNIEKRVLDEEKNDIINQTNANGFELPEPIKKPIKFIDNRPEKKTLFQRLKLFSKHN